MLYKTVGSEALAIRSCIFLMRCFIADYFPALADPSFLLTRMWAEEYGMFFLKLFKSFAHIWILNLLIDYDDYKICNISIAAIYFTLRSYTGPMRMRVLLCALGWRIYSHFSPGENFPTLYCWGLVSYFQPKQLNRPVSTIV